MPILKSNPVLSDSFWRFVRGDMETSVFEDWLYSSEEIEKALGAEEFLAAISLDYRDAKQVAEYKSYLRKNLSTAAACACQSQPDNGSVGLGEWPVDRFEVLEREIDGIWWLHRLKCKECGTVWRLAAEERIFDVWLLQREPTADHTPIRTYLDLLIAAKASGSVVRYLEPSVSWEIPKAIQAMAEETPGIACSEIERILPVDAEVVRQHARQVASIHGLSISFQG